MKRNLLVAASLLSLSQLSAQCPTPTLVTSTPSVVCAGATASLNAVAVGSSINWYTVPVSGTPIGSSQSGVDFPVSANVTTTFYAESVITANNTFSYTGALQQYVVPAGVTQVTITAIGASGGSLTSNGFHLGGLGASMQGVFAVVPGTTLNVVVGGRGNNDPSSSGGGGASGVASGTTPLIVAGGGAGVDFQQPSYAGRHAVITTTGVVGQSGGGAGGINGGDGGDHIYSTVNISRGGRGWNFNNAGSFGANGQSVNTTTTAGTWGLGGGGGSVGSGWCNCGGGGGGYSGGGSGSINNSGGGGGSYNSGTNQVNTTGVGTGNGTVVITAPGCISASRTAVTLSVNPNPTVTVNSGSVCTGNSFNISPSGANTYTIQGGNSVVTPTANSTYTVVGTSSQGCVSQVVTSTVTVNALPLPTVAVNSGTICSGNSFTMIANGAVTYTFQGGNSVVSPTANATYTVVGTNSAGCVSGNVATSTIVVNASPNLLVSGATTICLGQTASLTASGADTYSWSTGSTNAGIIVSPTVNTSYVTSGTLTATGCTKNITTNVVVANCTGLADKSEGITQMNVFPNPTNGELTLEMGMNGSKQISITDCVGKIVYNTTTDSSKMKLNIGSLAKGIYIVKVQGETGTRIARVVKE